MLHVCIRSYDKILLPIRDAIKCCDDDFISLEKNKFMFI